LSGFFDELRAPIDSDHAARQFVKALETDGFALVQLPEPESVDVYGNEIFHDGAVIAFPSRPGNESLLTRGGVAQLRVHEDWDCVDWSPDDLRAYAAALLAAASAAEAVTP